MSTRPGPLRAGRALLNQDVDYSCAFPDLRDNGEMRYGELRTKAGLARLSHLLMPISGQPEIGPPKTAAGFLFAELSDASDKAPASHAPRGEQNVAGHCILLLINNERTADGL